MRCRPYRLLLPAFAVIQLISFQSKAFSYILPLDEVERRGMTPEAPTLMKYLQADTPETTLLLPSTSDSLRDPWQLNSMVALALGDLKAHDAIPLLTKLIARPIPKKLDAALTAYVAADIAWDAKEQDWE